MGTSTDSSDGIAEIVQRVMKVEGALKDAGLSEVPNPSELFLAERPEDAAGSIVVSAIEGTRPILVELQALVSGTAQGNPRRTTMGIDSNRVSLLVAVLEKKVGYSLLAQDIFVNVAGGVRLAEPAVEVVPASGYTGRDTRCFRIIEIRIGGSEQVSILVEILGFAVAQKDEVHAE